MHRPATTARRILPAFALFAFAWLLYANTLGNEFVWDDRAMVVDNSDIRTLDTATIQRLLTTHYWDMTGRPGGLYRPLSALSFYLDYQVYGDDPAGYHATNATLNALVCVAVFALVLALFGQVLPAIATAALFAALPVHTENVAWVAGRTDLLATLFMLLSLLAWIWWRRRGAGAGFVLSAVAFVLALLAKEFALVLAPLVVVLELGPFHRLRRDDEPRVNPRRLAVTALVYFGLAASYFVVRRAVLGTTVQSFEPFATGVVDTGALALAILAQYVYRLVFPFALNAEWEAVAPASPADIHAFAGLVFLALIVWSAWRWRHRGEVVLSVAVFLIGIAPVLNIVPITELSAERFLYFPSLGFCIVLGWLLDRLARHRRAVAASLFLALLLAYSARTVARNRDWCDESTLFRATVAAADQNARAHLNLGNVHYREGRYRAALDEYRQALDIDPAYAGAWSSAAGAWSALGELDEALRCIQRAVEIEPTNANFHNSLGTLHVRRGRLDLAAESFEQALRFHPGHARARFNLGLARFKLGEYAAAIDAFDALDHKDTEFVHAYYYLALARLRTGAPERARRHAERFLSLYHPDDAFRNGAREILAGRDPAPPAE